MVKRKIKRLVTNAEIQTILRQNAQFGYRGERGGEMKTQHPTTKGGIDRTERERRKRKCRRGKVYLPGTQRNDPVIEKIPGNEVNAATRHINLANALGVGGLGRKNRPIYRSSIIDTGVKGEDCAAILVFRDMLNT